MMSYQISLTPSKRVSGHFVAQVRRAIQKALAEEEKERNVTQSDIARAIGVNRSVISREIRGHKDLTLSCVAELAWAMGRKPSFALQKVDAPLGSNLLPISSNTATSATGPLSAVNSNVATVAIPKARVVNN